MKPGVYNSLFEFLQAFPDEQACVRHLEQLRWPDGVVSPYDPASKIYNYGGGKYRCKNTGKNFNVKINTLFEGTKLPLQKWFLAIWLVTTHKKGITSVQLAKDLGVTQKTAWFLLQRIRECFDMVMDTKLDGAIELDETFVGGKNKNRHRNKKVRHCQGRSFKDKTPVMGMLERGGRLICKVVRDTSYRSLTVPILKAVKRTATLFSDEWGGYRVVSRVYQHYIVDHGKGQYVDEDAYTNTLEGFWGILKRGIIGIYNWVARKHLQRYVNEFVFRYNTRKVNNSERFNLLLNNSGHRITYKQLTNG